MAITTDIDDMPRRRLARWWLIPGLVLALAGAAGGFWGMRLLRALPDGETLPGLPATVASPAADVPAWVEIEPLVITLPRASGRQFLRFTATLDVAPDAAARVQALMPRIIDVMNGYLRAVEPGDFENRMILADLRAQLLRRIQVVTGEGQVRDLLVMEFVLN
ncbi:MAG: flagellar basal body-associated FliL family protein [Rubellimicrobium sp.]|nr:flagellar basal body-associated FliL family protein [Rubellimicrobium sp.]